MNRKAQNSDYYKYRAATCHHGPASNRAKAAVKMLKAAPKAVATFSSPDMQDSLRFEESHESPPPAAVRIVQSQPQQICYSWVPPHLRFPVRSQEARSPPAEAVESLQSQPQNVDSHYPPLHLRFPSAAEETQDLPKAPILQSDESEILLIELSDPVDKNESLTLSNVKMPVPSAFVPDIFTPGVSNSSAQKAKLPPHLRLKDEFLQSLLPPKQPSNRNMPTVKAKCHPKITKNSTMGGETPLRLSNSKRLPPGVTIRKGPIWNVIVIDLYACNVNTFCEKFTKTAVGCKKKKCEMVHDDALRQEYAKQRELQQKSLSSGGSVGVKLSASARKNASRKNKAMKAKAIMAPVSVSTKETTLTPTYPSAAATNIPIQPRVSKPARPQQPQQPWDQEELVDWAKQNLNPATIDKLMVPHILAGHLPQIVYSPQKNRHAIFHHFGQLPGEIRNKIWRYAQTGGGRDVKIKLVHYDTGVGIQPTGPPPPLFLVNKESRSLAIEYWLKTFDTFCNPKPATVHFKYEQDRLWINNISSYDLVPMILAMKPQHRHYIRWISLPLKDYIAQPDDAMRVLSYFKKVNQIWFVAGDSYEDQPIVKTCPPTLLNSKLKYWWRKQWKNSRIKEYPPKCNLDIIHALEARQMGIDGLKWH